MINSHIDDLTAEFLSILQECLHRGMVSPLEFIPVAERTGQIIELGEWVMGEVARHYLYWDSLGIKPFKICVNISPLQFNQADLPEWISSFLKRSKLAPE